MKASSYIYKVMFTCHECLEKYTLQTGDVDERMCNKCLNKEKHG